MVLFQACITRFSSGLIMGFPAFKAECSADPHTLGSDFGPHYSLGFRA